MESMGTYHGGSTIINTGRYKPVGPKIKHKRISNAKKRQFVAAQMELLYFIVNQMLLGNQRIQLPDKLHPSLRSEIAYAGSPISWAVKQRDFVRVNIRIVKEMRIKKQELKKNKEANATRKKRRTRTGNLSKRSDSKPRHIAIVSHQMADNDCPSERFAS